MSIKERPILFSAPMVRAILDGRKTQTRRIVKPQPPTGTVLSMLHGNRDPDGAAMKYHAMAVGPEIDAPKFYRCPFGLPGDRLWVRETWGYKAQFFTQDAPGAGEVVYGADGEPEGCHGTAWRPSIHMPRNLCRITLEVTGVRVERLQDISVGDCICEGMQPTPWHDTPSEPRGKSENDQFQDLWIKINGGESWDSDPWVWVIEFKRITPT